MYICVCKGITDKMLKDSITSQGGNISKGLKALGVGSECGTCLHEAATEIKKQLNKKNENNPSNSSVISK